MPKRRRNCCGSNGADSNFLAFCRETELNGLLHVPQTQSTILRVIYVVSFVGGLATVLYLFGGIVAKYMAQPKGIDQEFVTSEPMPFPELKLCRYLVGLSDSSLKAHNVSHLLAKLLHWRLEVNYAPGFLPEWRVRRLLKETRAEYEALTKKLNLTRFYQVMQYFLPKMELLGHPTKAIVYQKLLNLYDEQVVAENSLITYVEDLYLYNSICHIIQPPPDSVLALVIPFPPKEDYHTLDTQNFQLLPITRSFLLMDGNHDPIARIQPGRKYWAQYKLKSSYLMNSEEQACRADAGYHQQRCVQACFGSAVLAAPTCSHCQSVFMHVDDFTRNSTDICDPWEYVRCNSTLNQLRQSQTVVGCMNECILACQDLSFEYTVSSVSQDDVLSGHVGWQADFFEISANRSIFILSSSNRPNKHIRIRQYPIVDLASVFGDVGGYLGLFLGGSVLTLFHAVLFWSRTGLLRPAADAYRRTTARGGSVSCPPQSALRLHRPSRAHSEIPVSTL